VRRQYPILNFHKYSIIAKGPSGFHATQIDERPTRTSSSHHLRTYFSSKIHPLDQVLIAFVNVAASNLNFHVYRDYPLAYSIMSCFLSQLTSEIRAAPTNDKFQNRQRRTRQYPYAPIIITTKVKDTGRLGWEHWRI